jgi:hypothetical protein
MLIYLNPRITVALLPFGYPVTYIFPFAFDAPATARMQVASSIACCCVIMIPALGTPFGETPVTLTAELNFAEADEMLYLPAIAMPPWNSACR